MYDELRLRITGGRAWPSRRTARRRDRCAETNLVVQAPRAAFDALGEQPPGLELPASPGSRTPAASAHRPPRSSPACGRPGAGLAGVRDRAARPLRLAADRGPSGQRRRRPVRRADHRVDGRRRAAVRGPARLRLHGIVPVAFIPRRRASTAQARRVLPATVSHADAAVTRAAARCWSPALTSAPRGADGGHRGPPAPAVPAAGSCRAPRLIAPASRGRAFLRCFPAPGPPFLPCAVTAQSPRLTHGFSAGNGYRMRSPWTLTQVI